jgi:archaellin
MKNKKGEWGVGFQIIIIFLGLVLVAMIAGHTILTSVNRQAKMTKKTSDDARIRMGQSIIPIEMKTYVENGSAQKFYMLFKISPNHNIIPYENISMIILTGDNNTFFSYDNSSDNCSGYSIGGQETFTLKPVINSDRYSQGTLSQDDMVQMCFSPHFNIPETTKFNIWIVFAEGSRTTIEVMMPNVYEEGITRIFP